MADIDLSAFKELYFKTANEYVTSLEESYKRLSTSHADAEAANQAFISSHSLKSQSHVMGHEQVSALAALLEKVFRGIKEGTLTYTDTNGVVIGQAVTALRTSIAALEQGGAEPNLQGICTSVSDATGIVLR